MWVKVYNKGCSDVAVIRAIASLANILCGNIATIMY